MKTYFGLINEYEQGDSAVRELLENGFALDKINVVVSENIAKNAMDGNWERIKTEKSEELGEPGTHGLDGLLGGEQAVQLPDAGQVYAAGELANLLTDAASVPGTTDGGLKAALIEFNLPPDAADYFVESIKDGGLLFFVRTEDERASEAERILRAHKAQRVRTSAG